MTRPRPHVRYEELVAGHALAALEPEDEQDLLRHLPGLRRLRARPRLAPRDAVAPGVRRRAGRAAGRALGGHPRAVLPRAGRRPSPPPDLSAGAVASAAPAPVDELRAARERRSRRTRVAGWVSVAAAAGLVVALGIWNVDLQRARDAQVDASRAAERRGPGARDLAGAHRPAHRTGRSRRAVAVLQQDGVDLVVDGIDPNDAATHLRAVGQARRRAGPGARRPSTCAAAACWSSATCR